MINQWRPRIDRDKPRVTKDKNCVIVVCKTEKDACSVAWSAFFLLSPDVDGTAFARRSSTHPISPTDQIFRSNKLEED